MTETSTHKCTNCGEEIVFERRNHRYAESGVPNVILQGVRVAECHACGNSDVSIPCVAKIHRAIAHAIANSPARLTGPQVRFSKAFGTEREWTALDEELRPQVAAVAEHLPEILDQSGGAWELHVDVETLQTAFISVSRAA